MKKHIRFAAILAGAMMLCSAIPAAPVSALYCWGTADGKEFADMQQVDDKGMFKWIGYGGIPGTPRDYQVLTYHYSFDREDTFTDLDTGETITEMRHHEGDPVYVVCPRENSFRFVLKKDLDEAEAETKMLAILDQYYPEISTLYLNYKNGNNYYGVEMAKGTVFPVTIYDVYDYCIEISDRSETAGSVEITGGIMRDLAKAGLISEFYTWGQTANYQEIWNTYPTAYYPTSQKWNSSYNALEDVTYDWTAIEAWVEENHPECEFICVTPDDIETAKLIGQYDSALNKVFFNDNIEQMYAVIPPEGTAFSDHFAIAAELYEQFGLAAEWSCPESINEQMIGQNALAVAGDVNIDCSIDVADAVLLARFCAEDAAANITQTGLGNADYDGDGMTTILDVTAILRKTARLD